MLYELFLITMPMGIMSKIVYSYFNAIFADSPLVVVTATHLRFQNAGKQTTVSG